MMLFVTGKRSGTLLSKRASTIFEKQETVYTRISSKKGLATRQAVINISFVVHAMYSFLEIKNARNFMKLLHERGEISDVEYRAWKKKAEKD
jgi:hypothetical protein